MDFALYSYKLTRDFGFAPNPFHEYCTLACCKPQIRRIANEGDWILGTGSVELGNLYHIIYFMKVNEVKGFQEYWDDPRFLAKRPTMTNDIYDMHGDNVYHEENGEWKQEDSQHSFEGGVLNKENLDRDMGGKKVLISTEFFYFGSGYFEVPDEFKVLCCNERQRYHKTIREESLINDFLYFMNDTFDQGVHGLPISWSEYESPEYQQYSLF